jgi:DNA-binding response OmpR family regulator
MMPRILIVDDEEAVLFGMREYFTIQGFEVDCVRELAQARSCLASTVYSLVIADLRLTGSGSVEGLEVIRCARATPAQTPVILLTAYGTPELEAKALRLGANAVVFKPRPLREISDVVDALINS